MIVDDVGYARRTGEAMDVASALQADRREKGHLL